VQVQHGTPVAIDVRSKVELLAVELLTTSLDYGLVRLKVCCKMTVHLNRYIVSISIELISLCPQSVRLLSKRLTDRAVVEHLYCNVSHSLQVLQENIRSCKQ
jgi:hypothetical protein